MHPERPLWHKDGLVAGVVTLSVQQLTCRSLPLLLAVLNRRCRLYRVSDGEWKQRGTGDVKILKHKSTGKYRVVMRQEKTLKLIANHRLDPTCTLVRHPPRTSSIPPLP